LKRMAESSWFSITALYPQKKNLSQISYPSSLFSPVEFTDSESTLVKSRKIRIYPSKVQKKILSRWFGTARFVYNKTVDYLQQAGTKANFFAIKTGLLNSLPDWSREVPYQIKSIAVRDACQAVKAAKLKAKKTGKHQCVKFRSRRQQDYNLYIPKSSVNNNGFYCTILGAMNLREEVGRVDFDCRFTLYNGRYFLSKPEPAHIKKPENQRYPVVALDPGVRTFQTMFCPDGVVKVGSSEFSRIFRLCYSMDKLISKRKRSYKASYTKALARIRWKIKDLISEIHHKLANMLVRSFEVILLPSFETSKMVTKLHSKTSRAMLTWAHYRFKEFIKFKAREYSSIVLEVDEAYTSKTCSKCGKINYQLKGQKIFNCSCGLKIDRDYNGARGILLKNFFCAERSFPALTQG
jgi:putative transposase